MNKLRRYGKIILFDSLAVICFIGVIAFGWLPGPGGVPLFLLGLGLLAANHTWAERWLETAKHKGVTLKNWLFPDKAWVRLVYDIGAVLVVSSGLYLLLGFDHRLLDGLGSIMMTFGLFIFLLNRDRFDTLRNLFKRKYSK